MWLVLSCVRLVFSHNDAANFGTFACLLVELFPVQVRGERLRAAINNAAGCGTASGAAKPIIVCNRFQGRLRGTCSLSRFETTSPLSTKRLLTACLTLDSYKMVLLSDLETFHCHRQSPGQVRPMTSGVRGHIASAAGADQS